MWSDPEVETILPGVHRAPVPLPHDGLRAINVYVVEHASGVTLVDAGWDDPLARAAVDAGLAVAGATVADVDRILVTHVHYDHVGQATALRRAGAGAFWLGEGEQTTWAGLTEDPKRSRRRRRAHLSEHGGDALAEELASVVIGPPEPKDWLQPDRWTADGDVARLPGGGSLMAVNTPGHTAGHVCFVDGGRRLLFAGDHILPHITPSIGLEGTVNRLALADFYASLARVRALDIDLVLPAHGAPFDDLAGRVDELTAHHDVRLAQCVAALTQTGPSHAYRVAGQLPWTRRETAFDDLDAFNKVLAVLETAAHLELLAARSEVERSVDDDGKVGFTQRVG